MNEQGREMPLMICPRCASPLIYARDIAGTRSTAVLARRCPECEHRDCVITTVMAADAWLGRDARLTARLSIKSNALAAARIAAIQAAAE